MALTAIRGVVESPLQPALRSPLAPGVGGAPLSLTAQTQAIAQISGRVAALFDTQDLSTMYTTRAGSTLIGTPGNGTAQFVGRWEDISRGRVLGAELVANGSFDSTTTGWAPAVDSVLSVESGTLKILTAVAQSAAGATVATVVGKTYKFSAEVIEAERNTSICVGTGVGGSDLFGSSEAAGPRTVSCVFVAVGATTHLYLLYRNNAPGQFARFDNISVRELPGHHALAPNDTTGRVQLSARVNLVERTEDFSNVYWSKTRSVITSGFTDPLGGTTANKITDNSAGGANSVIAGRTGITLPALSTEYTWSASLKADQLTIGALRVSGFTTPGNVAAYFNLATGAVMTVGAGLTAAISSQGNGWYRCSIKFTLGAVDANGDVQILPIQTDNNNDCDLDGTSSIFIWGADLRPTNVHAAGSIPPYQRVVDAETYDSVGFPYRFIPNGTGQGLTTSTITPGSDKVTVVSGLRKLSDASRQIVLEHGNWGTPLSGSLTLNAPTSGPAQYVFSSGGTTAVNASTAVIAAPDTAVMTLHGSISAPSASINRNNGTPVVVTTTQGTGNYLAYSLNIFGRSVASGGSLWFGGQGFRQFVCFGPALSAGELATVESWVNESTKAY